MTTVTIKTAHTTTTVETRIGFQAAAAELAKAMVTASIRTGVKLFDSNEIAAAKEKHTMLAALEIASYELGFIPEYNKVEFQVYTMYDDGKWSMSTLSAKNTESPNDYVALAAIIPNNETTDEITDNTHTTFQQV